MHFVLFPISFIHFSIRPNILAHARYFIILELTCICTSISKSQTAIPMLLPILIVPFVFCTIWPFFNSFSMLLIFKPLTNISCTISMLVCPMTMSFVIEPLAFIDISICMYESSMTVCLIP